MQSWKSWKLWYVFWNPLPPSDLEALVRVLDDSRNWMARTFEFCALKIRLILIYILIVVDKEPPHSREGTGNRGTERKEIWRQFEKKRKGRKKGKGKERKRKRKSLETV